jgi:subtilisin family serine protease
MINRVAESKTHPVLIAAAGNFDKQASNDKQDELAYPSWFRQVMAIGSITSAGDLSSFSKYGPQDNKDHTRHFVLPGGEYSPRQSELIGAWSNQQRRVVGTSYAAGYASGYVATLLAQHGVQTLIDGTFWSLLKATTQGITNYDKAKHGLGLLKKL